MTISQERKERLRDMLSEVLHLALATVDQDGTPHNSPVFAAFDSLGHFVWSSHPDALHSQNIARTGRTFITIFDSHNKGGGLYIDADAAEASGNDLQLALQIFNAKREHIGRSAMRLEQFLDDAPQRLYIATARQIYANQSERSVEGFVIRDHRLPLTLQEFSVIVGDRRAS